MAAPRGRREAPAIGEDAARVMGFVNTLSARGSAMPSERLTSFAALLDWARTANLLSTSAASQLRHAAESRPQEAARALERARELRETLHGLFTAMADERPPSSRLLATLGEHLGSAYAKARLVVQERTLQWAPGELASLDDIGSELARAAARLVGSDHLARVRACAADDCRWWFVDETRNGSRRWCEMKTCGNRAKVRRFREKGQR